MFGSVSRFPCLLSKNYSVWHIIHHHSCFFFYTKNLPVSIVSNVCLSIYFFSIRTLYVQFLFVLHSKELDFLLLMGLTCKRYLLNFGLSQEMEWRKEGEIDKLSRFEAQINAIKICKDRSKKKTSHCQLCTNIFCVQFIKYSKCKVSNVCCIVSFDR